MSDAFSQALENPGAAPSVELPSNDVDVGEISSNGSNSSSCEEEESDEEDGRGVEGDAEEEEEEGNGGDAIRSKNEVAEEPVPDLPDDYEIPESATISPIGKIKSAFENNIVVEAVVSGEKRVLKEGSILCLEDMYLIGVLCEVFGPLQKPFYRVTLPASKSGRFEELKGKVGCTVCIVVPEAHWVDTFELKKFKGTDASNGYDEELPEEEQEFSDDEKEAIFKKMKKEQHKKKKGKDNEKTKQAKSGGVEKKSASNLPSMKLPQTMASVSYRSRTSRQAPQSQSQSQPQPQPQPRFQPHLPSQLPPQPPHQVFQPAPAQYNYGMPYAQPPPPSFQPFMSPYPQTQPLYQSPMYYPPQPQPQFPLPAAGPAAAPALASAPAPAPAQQNMQQVLQLHQLLVQQQQQQQQQSMGRQHFNYDD